jgi:parvulin-like peptidyl-prolyl isomerase
MRILREPWVHFLVLGVALFALSVVLSDRDTDASDQRIDMTATEIEWLARNWKARWQRPPTEAELRGLVDDYIRQEVLYREALKMGLDQDDEIIRRRMVQKIEFLTEDLAAQAQPTEAELQSYLQENLDKYRLPERRSFTHIYFNIDRRGDAAVDAAEETLAGLRGSPNASINYAELGDRFMLAHDYSAQSEAEVTRQFGQRFATALFEIEPGDWQGPVGSGYGLHLVRVTDVWEGSVPELDMVRNEVLRDFATELRDQARQAMFSSLATQYEISIDEEAIAASALAVDTEGVNR